MAVLALEKAAANCVTSDAHQTRELRELLEKALEYELTDTRTVHQMATNLRRGRSEISLIICLHAPSK